MQKNVSDDLTDEEIQDIKEFYTSNEKGKTHDTLEEFLEELKN